MPITTESSATAAVPLCDLDRQTAELEPQLLEAVQRVLRSGRFILGPEEAAFTTELADYLGAGHAVGVASGTDALTLALRAAGVRPGDHVITTPFTFFATAEAIVLAGAKPVFADIDPVTYNIDTAAVQAIVDGSSSVHGRLGIPHGEIAAVLPVHLFGHPADMSGIGELAASNRLLVIEDAAQALGAETNGRRVGTLGDAGCFSFFPSKNLGGFGDGGAVVTNNAELARSVAALRAHGASSPHHHEQIGQNSRLDEIQAAMLRIKQTRLDDWLARRRAIAQTYRELLADVPGVSLPQDTSGGGHAYGQFTVRVHGGRRDELRRSLGGRGIATAVYYPRPLHFQNALRDLGYRPDDMPVAEQAATEVLSLPMFPELQHAEIARVATAIREFEQ